MNDFLEKFTSAITKWFGTTQAFVISTLFIIVWLCLGPFFDWSTQHSFVGNNIMTIITFLMVFLLQRASNKENLALHLKVNELLAAHPQASNRMIGIERLTEQEVRELWVRFMTLAEKAAAKGGSHSIEDIPPPAGSSMKWMYGHIETVQFDESDVNFSFQQMSEKCPGCRNLVPVVDYSPPDRCPHCGGQLEWSDPHDDPEGRPPWFTLLSCRKPN